ncbi:type II toxin-antitoxin system HicB family antitoxin [Alicyclobacillus vulcanalis]|uniref:type II toxin-antitoxin system HicB family antitoxin n=1 Tax=Alicyclobacillus vulcanalis TaxID=252246 RepID=UPI001F3ED79E|nr:type II toxin-antitoxin system HicB family antitoxin [Alicyclobacillus vulcanalis]
MVNKADTQNRWYSGANPKQWIDILGRITVTAEFAATGADGHVYIMSATESAEYGWNHLSLETHKPHSSRIDLNYAGGDNMTTYPVILKPDEDGGYVVECPVIPGCFSEGDTEEEALENIKEAIRGLVEVRRELGLEPTLRVRYVEV